MTRRPLRLGWPHQWKEGACWTSCRAAFSLAIMLRQDTAHMRWGVRGQQARGGLQGLVQAPDGTFTLLRYIPRPACRANAASLRSPQPGRLAVHPSTSR